MLGRSSHDFNVFATTGINETKILLGRRYGGCSIYIHKKLNSSVDVYIAVYMTGDMLSNIDEFNFVLSSFRALQQLY